MANTLRYPVPAGRCRVEDTIDRSRFICTVARASSPEDAHRFIREVTHEFPDATHNCWAFVAGAPGSSSRIGMSDDGEPHGTAGRPMLTVLLHSGVGEIVVVVTRFYGGTKLGTGGLVRAYSGAVQSARQHLATEERVEWAELGVIIGYAHLAAVLHQLHSCEATISREAFAEDVTLHLRVPVELRESLRAIISDSTSGQVVFLDDALPVD